MHTNQTKWKSRTLLSQSLVGVSMLLIAGCAGTGLGMFSLLGSALLVLSLVISACADSHRDAGGAGSAGTAGTSAGNGGSAGVGGTAGAAGMAGIGGVGGSAGVGGTGGTSGTGGSGGTGEMCFPIVECNEGTPVDAIACCAEDETCNYYSATICADGSCVNPWDQCVEDCDGTIEQTCEDGALVDVCCPAGVACNYAQGVEVCADGSCVNYPDACPPDDCFTGLDCIDGMPVETLICGCPQFICNYFPAPLCDDGTCVDRGELCPN